MTRAQVRGDIATDPKRSPTSADAGSSAIASTTGRDPTTTSRMWLPEWSVVAPRTSREDRVLTPGLQGVTVGW
jgi:hypothetical protein